MKIAIFAARKTHRHYANKLSEYLRHMGATETTVLWYKDLWRTPYWLRSIFSRPEGSLTAVAADFVKAKKNSPGALDIGTARYNLLFPLKLIEARLLYAIYRYSLNRRKVTHMVIWNGLKFRQRVAVMAARDQGIPCYFIERGLFPGTTTLDPQGINYLNSVPRDPSFYRNTTGTYTVGTQLKEERPAGLPERYIFIPFQVNTDSQITMFSPWINNMFELVKLFELAETTLGTKMPYIVFKPHPACEQNYDDVIISINTRKESRLRINTDIPTPLLIQHSEAVCTINSSVGMEAILADKPLLVLGSAFYTIKGVSTPATNFDELCNALENSDLLTPDQRLRSQFLSHISNYHIVPGSWQNPDDEHLDSMSKRILKHTGSEF